MLIGDTLTLVLGNRIELPLTVEGLVIGAQKNVVGHLELTELAVLAKEQTDPGACGGGRLGELGESLVEKFELHGHGRVSAKGQDLVETLNARRNHVHGNRVFHGPRDRVGHGVRVSAQERRRAVGRGLRRDEPLATLGRIAVFAVEHATRPQLLLDCLVSTYLVAGDTHARRGRWAPRP